MNYISFKKLNISKRLPLCIILISLISISATGVFAFYRAQQASADASSGKLRALLDARKSAMTSYLESIKEDVLVLSQNATVIEALTVFDEGFNQLGEDGEDILQRHYITENPHPLGQKEKLDQANDGSKYSIAHGKHHPWFRKLLRARGYYDVFLITKNGDIAYSVFKENDYATNLKDGAWRNTDIGKVFGEVRNNPQSGYVAFTDFSPYAPSNDAPASFIATPILEPNGQFQGALVFQMPVDRINDMMQLREGMGKSGETFLVGADLLMRSNSRFSEEPTILTQKVETETSQKAVNGEQGVEITTDYRGTLVLSAFDSISFQGVTWGVLAEIDEAEILAPVKAMRNSMIVGAMAILLIVGAFGIVISRSIVVPLQKVSDRVKSISADSDLTQRIEVTSNDEIGQLSLAFNNFVDKTQNAMITIANSSGTLAGSAEELAVVNDQVGSNSEETTEQASVVSAAAEEVSASITTVASAVEELNASIRTIAGNATHSAKVAKEATSTANGTDQTVSKLSQASKSIGNVIELIKSIAEQTNLLALNASIEAARAGDAGRGFAVVANEVKDLAKETTKATADISKNIEAIQTASTEVVGSIQEMKVTIGKADELSTTIAITVEEQIAVTGEIARSITEVSAASTEIASNISGMAKAAKSTSGAVSQAQVAAAEQAGMAAELQQLVDQFKYEDSNHPDGDNNSSGTGHSSHDEVKFVQHATPQRNGNHGTLLPTTERALSN